MLDGVEADRAKLHRLLHRRMQVRKVEALQKTEHLHVFPPAMLGHAAFHQPAQRRELVRQIPALQRSCLIQGIDLLFDQRQVMNGIENDIFPFPSSEEHTSELQSLMRNKYAVFRLKT